MELGRGEGSRTKGRALILLESLHEKQAESPKATQQSPYLAACIIAYREGKDDSKSRYPQTRKEGFNAAKQEGEITISGMQKPCVVAIVRSGVRGQGPPRLGAGGYKYQESRI
jgi:hypothetical protein